MTTTTPIRPRTARPARPAGRTTDGPADTTTRAPARTPNTTPKPAKPARTVKRVNGAPARRPASRKPRPVAPPRAPFVLLVVGLLGGALVSLLLLNTVLAQDAFTATELQRSNQRLNQQRQALQEEIAREESPARLAPKAKALGMREPRQPAFVDAQTGQMVGHRIRPVPPDAAAAAAAAGVVGVPGAIVPGDGGAR